MTLQYKGTDQTDLTKQVANSHGSFHCISETLHIAVTFMR